MLLSLKRSLHKSVLFFPVRPLENSYRKLKNISMFLRKHGEKFIQSSPCFFRKEKIHFYRFKLESKTLPLATGFQPSSPFNTSSG